MTKLLYNKQQRIKKNLDLCKVDTAEKLCVICNFEFRSYWSI